MQRLFLCGGSFFSLTFIWQTKRHSAKRSLSLMYTTIGSDLGLITHFFCVGP